MIANYQEDCLVLNKLKNVDYRKTGKREEHWQEMKTHVETLQPILERWEVARDELNKILRKEEFDRWIKTIGAIGAITAVIITILKLF